MSERVVENLNKALHGLFEKDPSVYLIGEDLLDPYGGAFKVSKGLSTKYPQRVVSTPVSENAIMGMTAGLGLCGQKPIAEVMFGDFIFLGSDMIHNFMAKSVTMYGQRKDLSLVIRCPYGGHRGYGPTHSQSPQKYFMGVPNLMLFEMSPLHDNLAMFQKMFSLKQPCIYFEHKVLYTKDMITAPEIDNMFVIEKADDLTTSVIKIKGIDSYDATIILAGGLFFDCLAAAKDLFIEHEISVQLIVVTQLYPVFPEAWKDLLKKSNAVFIVEEGVAGGSWGEVVFWKLGEAINKDILKSTYLINSKEGIIPSSVHLEREILVQQDKIVDDIRKALA